MNPRLRPSAAGRWLHCPASVRLSEAVPAKVQDRGGPAALEGTRAHLVAEHAARRRFQGGTTIVAPDDDEMRDAAEGWTDTLAEEMDRLGPDTMLFLEKPIEVGIEDCAGTADAVLLSPNGLTIADLKYGMKPVSPKQNPQLSLYAYGALQLADLLFPIDQVRLLVYQPRVSATATWWDTTADELREWGAWAKKRAHSALHDDHPVIKPSEEACWFCPASGVCRARAEWVSATAFGDPNKLTSYEIAALLRSIPSLLRWCEDVKEAAKSTIQEGSVIPGWKLKPRKGAARVTDPKGLRARLTELGVPEEEVTKLASVTQLRKALGDKFDFVAAEFIENTDETFILVDAQTTAEQDFS